MAIEKQDLAIARHLTIWCYSPVATRIQRYPSAGNLGKGRRCTVQYGQMDTELPMMLVVTALALGFVSYLLHMQLGSLGVPARRVAALLIELWVSFGLIVTLFVLASTLIGPVARERALTTELQGWWQRVQVLPSAQQWLLLAMLVAALAILGHFLWILSDTRRQYEARREEMEDEE